MENLFALGNVNFPRDLFYHLLFQQRKCFSISIRSHVCSLYYLPIEMNRLQCPCCFFQKLFLYNINIQFTIRFHSSLSLFTQMKRLRPLMRQYFIWILQICLNCKFSLSLLLRHLCLDRERERERVCVCVCVFVSKSGFLLREKSWFR